MRPMACRRHHERVSIMALCMDEAQAIQNAMLAYANQCYGCGRELNDAR